MAEGIDECCREPARVSRQVAAEEELEGLAACLEPADELVEETRLADAGLPLDEHDLATPGLRLVEQRAQPRQLLAAAVERRLARQADPPQRPSRRAADRRGAASPPGGALPLVEHGGDLGGGSEPGVAVAREKHLQHLLEEGRELRVHAARRAGILVEVAVHRRCGIERAERVVPGRELVEYEPERVEVRPTVGVLPEELLRRRVLRRADERAHGREARRGVVHEGEAEVHHLHRVVVGDEDVLRLQVAVDGTGRVDGSQARGDLAADVAAKVLGHFALLASQDAQALARDVLHDEVEDVPSLVSPGISPDRAHDIGVAYAAPDLRLTQEAIAELLGEGESGPEHLDRHARPLRAVGHREVHGAHGARAELGDETVAPEPRFRHGGAPLYLYRGTELAPGESGPRSPLRSPAQARKETRRDGRVRGVGVAEAAREARSRAASRTSPSSARSGKRRRRRASARRALSRGDRAGAAGTRGRRRRSAR